MNRQLTLLPTAALAALLAAHGAFAAPNLVTNGDFEQETVNGTASTQSYVLTASNYGLSGAVVTGWTSQGNYYVYTPNTSAASGTQADNQGAVSPSASQNIKLWGPGDGSSNGLTISPTGGNFIGGDGAFDTGLLSQTISGLTVGYQYTLTYNWAAAQYQATTGVTTEGWTASFSDGTTTQSNSTPTITNASQGFQPWRQQTTTFRATSTSEVLSFLATGGPAGSPPFSLLDSVSLTMAVPEPASWGVLLGAVLGGFGLKRAVSRRKAAKTDAVAA